MLSNLDICLVYRWTSVTDIEAYIKDPIPRRTKISRCKSFLDRSTELSCFYQEWNPTYKCIACIFMMVAVHWYLLLNIFSSPEWWILVWLFDVKSMPLLATLCWSLKWKMKVRFFSVQFWKWRLRVILPNFVMTWWQSGTKRDPKKEDDLMLWRNSTIPRKRGVWKMATPTQTSWWSSTGSHLIPSTAGWPCLTLPRSPWAEGWSSS